MLLMAPATVLITQVAPEAYHLPILIEEIDNTVSQPTYTHHHSHTRAPKMEAEVVHRTIRDHFFEIIGKKKP